MPKRVLMLAVLVTLLTFTLIPVDAQDGLIPLDGFSTDSTTSDSTTSTVPCTTWPITPTDTYFYSAVATDLFNAAFVKETVDSYVVEHYSPLTMKTRVANTFSKAQYIVKDVVVFGERVMTLVFDKNVNQWDVIYTEMSPLLSWNLTINMDAYWMHEPQVGSSFVAWRGSSLDANTENSVTDALYFFDLTNRGLSLKKLSGTILDLKADGDMIGLILDQGENGGVNFWTYNATTALMTQVSDTANKTLKDMSGKHVVLGSTNAVTDISVYEMIQGEWYHAADERADFVPDVRDNYLLWQHMTDDGSSSDIAYFNLTEGLPTALAVPTTIHSGNHMDVAAVLPWFFYTTHETVDVNGVPQPVNNLYKYQLADGITQPITAYTQPTAIELQDNSNGQDFIIWAAQNQGLTTNTLYIYRCADGVPSDIPGEFNLLIPENNAFINDPTLYNRFTWAKSTLAFEFHFELFDKQGSLVKEHTIPASFYCNNETNTCGVGQNFNFIADGTYTWQVTAKNVKGERISTDGPFTFIMKRGGNPLEKELLVNGDFEATNNGEWKLRTLSKIKCNTDLKTITPFGTCALMVNPGGRTQQNIDISTLETSIGDILTLTGVFKTRGAFKIIVVGVHEDLTREKLIFNSVQKTAGSYFDLEQSKLLTAPIISAKMTITVPLNSRKVFLDELSLTHIPAEIPLQADLGDMSEAGPTTLDLPAAPEDFRK